MLNDLDWVMTEQSRLDRSRSEWLCLSVIVRTNNVDKDRAVKVRALEVGAVVVVLVRWIVVGAVDEVRAVEVRALRCARGLIDQGSIKVRAVEVRANIAQR